MLGLRVRRRRVQSILVACMATYATVKEKNEAFSGCHSPCTSPVILVQSRIAWVCANSWYVRVAVSGIGEGLCWMAQVFGLKVCQVGLRSPGQAQAAPLVRPHTRLRLAPWTCSTSGRTGKRSLPCRKKKAITLSGKMAKKIVRNHS